MRLFGLIGYPLSHSFSEEYFQKKFSREGISHAAYKNFSIPKVEVVKKIISDNSDLRGLNVTIPYKEKILDFLDELDDEARKIGAVNTIKIASGKTKGFNTDYIGFMRSLIPMLKEHHKKALILGSGGAAKSIIYGLEKLNIEGRIISRQPVLKGALAYEQLTESLFDEYTVIINATPVGMFPDIEHFPEIPYEFITSKHILFDLVYNPEETQFLRKGKARGATVKNGKEMLTIQAEEAWKVWAEF